MLIAYLSGVFLSLFIIWVINIFNVDKNNVKGTTIPLGTAILLALCSYLTIIAIGMVLITFIAIGFYDFIQDQKLPEWWKKADLKFRGGDIVDES